MRLSLLIFLFLAWFLISCKKQPDIGIRSDDVVYFTSLDGNLYALDAITGDKRWNYLMDSTNLQPFWAGLGISSPIFEKGIIYVGHNNGKLYALDATTGDKKWEFASGSAIFSSPTVVSGIIYVGSNDKNIYALDANTGIKQWSFKTGDFVYSSPTVLNGVVYVGSLDNKLYALDARSGAKKWEFNTESYIVTSPAVESNQVFITNYAGQLFSLNATTGVKQWASRISDLIDSHPVSPIISRGTIFVTDLLSVIAFDVESGKKKWVSKAFIGFNSSPVVVDSTLYIGGYEGHNMIALNTTNGVKRWETFINIFDVLSTSCSSQWISIFWRTKFLLLCLRCPNRSKEVAI